MSLEIYLCMNSNYSLLWEQKTEMHDLVVQLTTRMAYETATDASVSHLASYPRPGNPTLMVMWRLHHNAYEHKIINAWTPFGLWCRIGWSISVWHRVLLLFPANNLYFDNWKVQKLFNQTVVHHHIDPWNYTRYVCVPLALYESSSIENCGKCICLCFLDVGCNCLVLL
jgi:hypothetical protein